MKKIAFCTAFVLFMIQPLLSQQIVPGVPNSSGIYSLTVADILANESDSVRYDYLWWFGDGAYAIKTQLKKPNPNTSHRYLTHSGLNTSLGPNNPNAYMTTLITTENYGHSGNPDLIHLDFTPTQTDDKFTTYLGNRNIGVRKFRNAVPGDTFYLIVTYRLPHDFNCFSKPLSMGSIDVSFSADQDNFRYIANADKLGNKSFLPHREEYDSGGNGSFRWNIPLNGMRQDEERTILLPFRYTGTLDEGTVDINFNFRYRGNDIEYAQVSLQSQTGSCSINESTSTSLNFAESHDPNSIDVNIKKVEDCNIGGSELEYTVHFENTGDGAANYVQIEVHLEDAHDLSDVQITKLPKSLIGIPILEEELVGYRTYSGNRNNISYQRAARFKRDFQNNTITFEFYTSNLLLGRDTNRHPSVSQDSIKFKIRIKNGYVIGDDPIAAYAIIVFDGNKAVGTNVVKTRCIRPACITEKACCPKEITYLVWILVGIIVIVILLILMFWCLCRRRR